MKPAALAIIGTALGAAAIATLSGRRSPAWAATRCWTSSPTTIRAFTP